MSSKKLVRMEHEGKVNLTSYWPLQSYNLSCSWHLIREGGWNKTNSCYSKWTRTHPSPHIQLQILLLHFMLFPLHLPWIMIIPVLLNLILRTAPVLCASGSSGGAPGEWSAERVGNGEKTKRVFTHSVFDHDSSMFLSCPRARKYFIWKKTSG